MITATVCIYSGRRNPQWPIATKEYDKLLLTIESLPRTEPQEQPSLLGYSGIIVTGGEKLLYAYKGVITVTEDDEAYGYIDKDGAIEKQLLQSAPLVVREEIKAMAGI